MRFHWFQHLHAIMGARVCSVCTLQTIRHPFDMHKAQIKISSHTRIVVSGTCRPFGRRISYGHRYNRIRGDGLHLSGGAGTFDFNKILEISLWWPQCERCTCIPLTASHRHRLTTVSVSVSVFNYFPFYRNRAFNAISRDNIALDESINSIAWH